MPVKSDSDNFVYKVIRDLEPRDHLCINPIPTADKINTQVIFQSMLAQVNCKQNITSLSLLVGMTVPSEKKSSLTGKGFNLLHAGQLSMIFLVRLHYIYFFSKYYFLNNIRVSNSLDQARHFVTPDLVPNCLPR